MKDVPPAKFETPLPPPKQPYPNDIEKAFNNLGIQFHNVDGSCRTLSDLFNDIAKAWNKLILKDEKNYDQSNSNS